MDATLLTIISTVTWQAIKEGAKVLVETIKAKFEEQKKSVSNDDCVKITEIANSIPECYRLNEKLIEGYLQTNSQLIGILERLSLEDNSKITQYSYGSGDNIGRDKIIYKE